MRKKLKGVYEKASVFHDKHENIIMILLLTLIACAYSFHYKFMPYDYLWNFGNIYKLFLGYKIYEDVAIIITPLMFFIGKFIFKFFGANYFIYNVYNVLIEISYYICFFFILKKLIKSTKLRDLCLISLTLAVGQAFGDNGPNYIPFSAIFIMLILISFLYSKNKIVCRVVNGFLSALAFLAYQKAGAVAVLIVIIYELVTTDSKKISEKLKNLFITGTSMLLILGVFIAYLALNNNIYSFWNIAILGISEFSDNLASWWGSIFKITLFGLLTISYFILLKKYKKIDEKLKLLFIASLTSILYVYPIFNEYHIFIWLTFDILFIIYSINVTFDEIELNSIKQEVMVIILIGMICFYIFALGIVNMVKNPFYKTNYQDKYFGSTISIEQSQQIKEINEYIESNKEKYDNIIIFSSYALFYDNTYENNNRFFDIPNKGNFGKDGEQGLIDSITKMENTLMLVQNEDSRYEVYQFPKNVRKFIQDNYECIDNLQNYDIYEINNK